MASLALLLCGLVFGGLSYPFIVDNQANPLMLVPSVVAAVLGATHLTKIEAPRPVPRKPSRLVRH